MNCTFCCIPLESSSTFELPHAPSPAAPANAWARRWPPATADALELGQEDEVFDDLHLLVEAALFRKISNAVEQAAAQRLPRRREPRPSPER